MQRRHEQNSDSSSDNSDYKPNAWTHSSIRPMEKRSLRHKYKQIVIPQPPIIPSEKLINANCHNENETGFQIRCKFCNILFIILSILILFVSYTHARYDLQFR